MDIMKKISSEVLKVSNKVKDKANNVSMDAKIYEQEKKIKDLNQEIGKLIVIEMDNGTSFSEEITERYDAILKIRETIKDLEAKKVQEESKAVVCPNCNTKLADGMNFCGNCGQKVEVKVDDDDDEDDHDDHEEKDDD